MDPQNFSRRVLLCVTGTSPQIITETLYALAVESGDRPRFVPTEIRILTTAKGAEQARLSLLAEDRDMLGRLCRDYALEGIHFDATCIEVFVDAQGQPMDDIVTPADNERAADQITRCVSELTSDADAVIHASIAGGRKTMGFYLGYAMSLFGREQDRVSHVLVSQGFDNHRDFFYKPPRPVTLRHESGWEMSTAAAEIHLAEIPIVRLRSSEFEAMSDRRLGFSEAVERANRLAAGSELDLRVSRGLGAQAGLAEITLGGETIKLSPAEALVFHWLAKRRLAGQLSGDAGWIERQALAYPRGAQRNLGYLNEIHALAQDVYGRESQAQESLEKSFGEAGGSEKTVRDPQKWLETHVSSINKKIGKIFGRLGAERDGIVSKGSKGALLYRLALAPERIRLEQ